MRPLQSLPLSLLLLCQHFLSVQAIWPFPSKRFTKNSLIDAGNLNLKQKSRVLAFGDFNGDQFLDIITLEEDHQTFSVNIWDHGTFQFHVTSTIKHPTKILNILPNDYDHDGRLDILVMGLDESKNETTMAIYYSDSTGLFSDKSTSIPASGKAQPVALDIDGDLMVDLLAADPKSGELKVWKNRADAERPFEIANPPFTAGTPCSISTPHSNAIVDLNGDCLADIFLLCSPSPSREFMSLTQHTYQIWTNNKSNGFTLSLSGSLPPNAGQVSFADMDRDGTIDMVFPTCQQVDKGTGIGTDCAINVAYNVQKKLCQAKVSGWGGLSGGANDTAEEGKCRKPDDLCEADEAYKFNFDNANPEVFQKIPLNSLFPSIKSAGLLLFDTTFSPPTPLAVKLGDANLDGFPDMLFVAAGDPHGGFLGIGAEADTVPILIVSKECKKGLVGCGEDGKGKRGWEAVRFGGTEAKDDKGIGAGWEALQVVRDARSVSFVDMDEDGTLDILIQRSGKQTGETITFVQNNIFYDAFFLKAIVLNGACGSGICNAGNDSFSYLPFGVSYSGASYKYTVLDTSGARSAAQAAQLPQTAYQSLLTPYSFIGLGRTNNYVENLFVGSTLHSNEHFINMEGVIPNSKVVFKPPPVVDGILQGSWKKELYLRPGEWIPWVTVAVVATTVLLAGVVGLLHLGEKREDERERRKASHMINFAAL